jgi:calcineurin-like phosphoesterase family protein
MTNKKEGGLVKVFASSDHHFYHRCRNIIKYADRPFDINDENCVIDCAKHMIEKHNNAIQQDDISLLVGDLSTALRGREDHFKGLLKLLNGRKILIRGNHDFQPDEFYLDAGFEAVVDYFKIPPYFINHYPCYVSKWNQKPEKEMMKHIDEDIHTVIHGHIHNKDPKVWDPDGIERINVCVDFTPNDFTPIELTQPEIVEFFKDFT